MKMKYEVEKYARDSQGQWMGFGAKRFPELSVAREYLASFANEQKNVLGNGTKIELRQRKGKRLLAIVGGRMENPTIIRDID
jgi:hypothetical protein